MASCPSNYAYYIYISSLFLFSETTPEFKIWIFPPVYASTTHPTHPPPNQGSSHPHFFILRYYFSFVLSCISNCAYCIYTSKFFFLLIFKNNFWNLEFEKLPPLFTWNYKLHFHMQQNKQASLSDSLMLIYFCSCTGRVRHQLRVYRRDAVWSSAWSSFLLPPPCFDSLTM